MISCFGINTKGHFFCFVDVKGLLNNQQDNFFVTTTGMTKLFEQESQVKNGKMTEKAELVEIESLC